MSGPQVVDDSLEFTVRVQPRASRSQVQGLLGGALKVRVAAPPVDGAANAAVVEVLAAAFGVRKADVEIVQGLSGRTKRVRIRGAGLADWQRVSGGSAASGGEPAGAEGRD